jgi:hypothetical protein
MQQRSSLNVFYSSLAGHWMTGFVSTESIYPNAIPRTDSLFSEVSSPSYCLGLESSVTVVPAVVSSAEGIRGDSLEALSMGYVFHMSRSGG